MPRYSKVCLLLLALFLCTARAQDADVGVTLRDFTESTLWNGEWVAQGTLFRIRVRVEESTIEIIEVESMGFEWTSEAGEIEGNVARVPVRYAGVSGIVQAQLIDSNTAVASAETCMPDFMVVCLLAKDRQAVFRKVSE